MLWALLTSRWVKSCTHLCSQHVFSAYPEHHGRRVISRGTIIGRAPWSAETWTSSGFSCRNGGRLYVYLPAPPCWFPDVSASLESMSETHTWGNVTTHWSQGKRQAFSWTPPDRHWYHYSCCNKLIQASGEITPSGPTTHQSTIKCLLWLLWETRPWQW